MRARITTRQVVALGLTGAIMMGAQVVMAPLPNIEPVSLLLICCAVAFGLRALYPLYVFVLLEGLIYGFGLWFINYLYVWLPLLAAALAFRRSESRLLWAVVSGAFGLSFGALCAIPYIFIGGWHMAFTYWIAGIPFDVLHCAGNALMAAFLVGPLSGLLKKLIK